MGTNKEICELGDSREAVLSMVFASDNRTLAVAHADGRIHVWEVISAKRMPVLAHLDGISCPAFSSDSKMLAFAFAKDLGDGKRQFGVQIWDITTQKELLRFDGIGKRITSVRFSGDGKLLAAASIQPAVYLWEVGSGQELQQWHFKGEEAAISIDLAPHALLLAWGRRTSASDQSGVGTVRLCDLATGQEVRQFVGNGVGVSCVKFSPDRRTLVSGMEDGTALVWDVAELCRTSQGPRPSPTSKELEELWVDLAGRDAKKSLRAVAAFTSAGEAGVGFLRQRLQPAPEINLGRIPGLIDALNSNQFASRDAAYRQLEDMLPAIEPQLRESLAGTTSPEVRTRLKTLLSMQGIVKAPESLRRIRAIQVLEHVGSPDAQQVLKTLAKGAPKAYETLDAQRALSRLSDK